MTTADVAARGTRRHETEHRIEMAAVAAAHELGFENVTIEEICARADIARSTFFTYFNARDTAVLGRALEVLPDDATTAIFDEHAHDLPLAAFHVIYASLEKMDLDPEVSRLRAELALSQPAANQAATALLTDAGEALMATLRDWLTANPEHARIPGEPTLESSLTNNAFYAGISAIEGGWMGASRDLEAAEAEYLRAIDDLRIVMGIQPE